MDVQQVSGRNLGDIFLYALSTCVWCKKTKAFLEQLDVAYRYVDVDLVPAEDEEEVMRGLARWNPQRNFPTIVINSLTAIVGYQPERIREVLGL